MRRKGLGDGAAGAEAWQGAPSLTPGAGRKPGSVTLHPLCLYQKPSLLSTQAKWVQGDRHSSGAGIAPCLEQPTRGLRPGRPRAPPYLALLRTGFAEPAASPRQLVGSYPTVSPLPCTHFVCIKSHPCSRGRQSGCRAVPFLWHFPGIAPPGRYPASCPTEPGLSSPPLHPLCLHQKTSLLSTQAKWVQGRERRSADSRSQG